MISQIGFNHALKLWGISKNEVQLIPNLQSQLHVYFSLVFIIHIIQFFSFLIALIQTNAQWYIAFPILPIIFLTSYFFYLLFISKSNFYNIFIPLYMILLGVFNGLFFQFFYFKEELLLNYGFGFQNMGLFKNFQELILLIKSEFYYKVFSAVITLLFVAIYSVPFLIIEKKSIHLLNQLKKLNEHFRG